jgi:hypothetical protein
MKIQGFPALLGYPLLARCQAYLLPDRDPTRSEESSKISGLTSTRLRPILPCVPFTMDSFEHRWSVEDCSHADLIGTMAVGEEQQSSAIGFPPNVIPNYP